MKFAFLALSFALVAQLTNHPATAQSADSDFERSMKSFAAETKGKGKEHEQLWSLFEKIWQYDMHEFPEWATSVGFPGQNAKWTDQSIPAIERRKRETRAQLDALRSIDRAALTAADQLNYDIFDYQLTRAIEGQRFPEEYMPINQLEGVQEFPANTIAQNPTKTVKDYEDILQRLRSIPVLVDESIALMNVGLQKGVTPPRVTLREVPQQIKNQIVSKPEDSPLLEPFKRFPLGIPASEQERLRKEAASIYGASIAPAYQKLLTYFTERYLPKTRESLALTDLPDGKAWYDHKVRASTTTKLSPEEIHTIGLNEVKRIRHEMDSLIVETKFKGTFADFSQFLRTDPKFFFNDGAELVAAYRDIAKRIDPQLMGQFGKLPRLQYGIEPVPAFNEKSQPTAYYRPGTTQAGRAGVFFANTYNIKTRPKWEMEALTLHEAVPGHHLQIALAQEMENVPEFRRHAHFTAFVEGWGLYAESLGPELSMYKDPYSRYGQLTYDMWRSIRLVVDTGIHSKGWTRQQAIDFFKENSSKSDHDITVEVDRYIVWPGQALAYKIGQLTFKELRDNARRELGDRFNVRAFHDSVLGNGALPLDTLRTKTSTWIAQQKDLVSSMTEYNSDSAAPEAFNVYQFKAKSLDGKDIPLSDYKGKVLLIVNTASECGYTPQYKELEELHEALSDKGLRILGFPCNQFGHQEPGTSGDIAQFCQRNYGVKFQMFEKIDVNGDKAHPLYKYLTHSAPGVLGSEGIKWNFTKFLINKEGKVVKRYAPAVSPASIKNDIVKELDAH